MTFAPAFCMRTKASLLAISLSLSFCMPPLTGVETATDMATLMSVQTFATGLTSYRELTQTPYASALGGFIRVWTSTPGFSIYQNIDPNIASISPPVPPGTVIIRAVSTSSVWKTSKLTVMAKKQAGYNPALGDWWFGVLSPTGQPLISNGVQQVGLLTACYGCHVPRASDDWLFGVPAAYKH